MRRRIGIRNPHRNPTPIPRSESDLRLRIAKAGLASPCRGPRMSAAPPPGDGAPRLERALGLPQATSLNVANMIGIGPFITIPIFLSKMGGPQALIGWILAAILVI